MCARVLFRKMSFARVFLPGLTKHTITAGVNELVWIAWCIDDRDVPWFTQKMAVGVLFQKRLLGGLCLARLGKHIDTGLVGRKVDARVLFQKWPLLIVCLVTD